MTLANWRDLAVVLLALEAFVMGLLPAAILYFCVRGISWTLRKVRGYVPPAQGVFHKIAATSDDISRRIAAPLISLSATGAQLRRMQQSALIALSPRSQEEAKRV